MGHPVLFFNLVRKEGGSTEFESGCEKGGGGAAAVRGGWRFGDLLVELLQNLPPC
jgi:hypothetical protein